MVTLAGRPRAGRAVHVQGAFPDSIRYPSARPTALLLARGFDVHVLARGTGRGKREIEGVTVWYEPSLSSTAERLIRLRPELAFFEGPSRELALLPVCHRRWVRTPYRSLQVGKAAAEQALLSAAEAVTFTNPYDATRWWVRHDRRLDLPYPVEVRYWSEPVARDADWWHRRDRCVPSGPVVAYVSNIVKGKRHAELTAALAPLLRRRPDMTLVIVGRTFDLDEMSRLEAVIRREAVADQMWLVGELERDDLRQLYAWTDVHALNTAHETQCMVVYESLAAGVPTLIPAIPSLTQAFPALLDHANGMELQLNVERLLDDRSLGQEQVRRSRSRVEWADVRRHDRLFAEHCARLLG
jgi:glycosyltransferase involved in cell wall biosynthesis